MTFAMPKSPKGKQDDALPRIPFDDALRTILKAPPKHIYLAFLAPDIVQRIIRGDHPPEWNATRLIRAVPLPLAWDEQRTRLGLIS